MPKKPNQTKLKEIVNIFNISSEYKNNKIYWDNAVKWKYKYSIISKVGHHSQGWPKGSLFNNYYTKG